MHIILISLIIVFKLTCNTFAKDDITMTDQDILKFSCSSCHSLNIVYQQRLNAERWKEIILLMYNEKKYEDRLINYLSKNYNY